MIVDRGDTDSILADSAKDGRGIYTTTSESSPCAKRSDSVSFETQDGSNLGYASFGDTNRNSFNKALYYTLASFRRKAYKVLCGKER